MELLSSNVKETKTPKKSCKLPGCDRRQSVDLADWVGLANSSPRLRAMALRVLSAAIQRMIAKWLMEDDLIKSAVRVELGSVRATKLLVRPEVVNDALAAAGLPFTATLVYIGDMLVSIPWLNWSTGEIVLQVTPPRAH